MPSLMMPLLMRISFAFFSFVSSATKHKGSFDVGVDVLHRSLLIPLALVFLVLRNGAKTSVQPVITVSLDEPSSADPKPEVVLFDFGHHQICSDEIEQ